MNEIKEVFGKPRVLLPVVHCCELNQALEQVELARMYGADGVFLINQGGMDADEVALLASDLSETSPDFWVGVNPLGCNPTRTWSLVGPAVRGVWSDDLFTPSTRFEGLYFGGAAFKGQAPVAPEEWPTAARNAVRVGADVVTTSGPRTGSPPAPGKVAAMRQAIGDHALALASGVTPENVHTFLPYVDAFLVATGIEIEFGQFNPKRLRELADKIHAD